MQNRLGPRFLSDNLDWVGVHQERILYILGFAFKEPLAIESLKELMTVIMYLNGLAEHKEAWITQVGQGGNSAAQTIQAVARIVIHIPKFFEHSKVFSTKTNILIRVLANCSIGKRRASR